MNGFHNFLPLSDKPVIIEKKKRVIPLEKTKKKKPLLACAAACILILAAGILYWQTKPQNSEELLNSSLPPKSSSQKASSLPESSKNSESSSVFAGVWYCSRENSCNDMEITLTITQDGSKLHFDRDMKSETGVGSSHLFGTAAVPEADIVYASYTSGIYSLDSDHTVLYERFENGKQNRYIKK